MKKARLRSSAQGSQGRAAYRESVLKIADSQFENNDLAGARTSLCLLERCSAHTLETLQAFGNICFLLGDYEAAAAAYCRVLAQNPADADLLVSLALTSYRVHDIAGCDYCIRCALRLKPAHPAALKILADRFVSRRCYCEAANTYPMTLPYHMN